MQILTIINYLRLCVNILLGNRYKYYKGGGYMNKYSQIFSALAALFTAVAGIITAADKIQNILKQQ